VKLDLSKVPREFTLMPFWFWNDELTGAELLRQIADFEAHGVYGFVIHPRVGLPRSIGWMSERLLHFMRVAIEEAARREMIVFLYDEGMYPSGSASGHVVAANPVFQCRGLTLADAVPPGGQLVAEVRRRNGDLVRVVDAPSAHSHIRGLHYVDEDRGDAEDCPPAADLLNPAAVACFLRLVYQRFYDEFRDHFGQTIQAIFTDEPSLLGRGPAAGFKPGTTGILKHVNCFLGYDFTPHLPALWFDDEPDAERYRADYRRAVQRRLDETYYQQLHDWCAAHHVALCGHPDSSEDIGRLRYFQIPGQDLVWRYVEPDKPSALEGAHSTMAKCSSSAMIHGGRRRNANEFCGAYGHQLTFAEMKWLADWCLVRGVNLLIPHAFYYSVRGPRRDERPPDVGPHSPWWGDFKQFADYCRWLCWLNTDSRHVCDTAILCESDHLPWRAAKVFQQHQRDFNYLERGDPAKNHYRLVIAEELPDAELLATVDRVVPVDLRVTPAQPNLRYRHVVKDGTDYYLLFNEGREPLRGAVQTVATGEAWLLDPFGGREERFNGLLKLGAYETRVLRMA
jgi:alpha-L-rhamnosidase